MADRDDFDMLLDRLKRGEHPEFGSISWDGRNRQITVTVQFERNGCPDEDEVVRARAVRYLQGLSAEERAAAEVEVVFREKKPVRAVLRAGTSELSPERLKDLAKRAGLE